MILILKELLETHIQSFALTVSVLITVTLMKLSLKLIVILSYLLSSTKRKEKHLQYGQHKYNQPLKYLLYNLLCTL